MGVLNVQRCKNVTLEKILGSFLSFEEDLYNIQIICINTLKKDCI
jgi:hypothetical protein